MKKMLLTLLSMATVLSVSAQKFKPAPEFLKGEKKINVTFDYSKVKFDGDSQEEQYEDKGEEWIEEWEGKRRKEDANAYIKSVNEELEKLEVEIGNFPDAPYTMIVEVLDCDFGAFAGPMSVPAKLKCAIRIVKTGTTEPLASMTLKESQNPYSAVGTPIDFDRMHLAFHELAEEVGEKLYKILK